MSRWIREHLGGLGFGGARRPPPPEPPQPDYSAEPELPCSYKAVGRASRGRERRRLSTLKGRAEAEDLDVTESRQHGCLGEGSSRRSGQQRSRSERPPRLTESFHRKCWLLDGSEMREESGVVLVEPDLERVYRAQRDRDFADPYTTTDQSDGLRESGAARPGEGETKEAVRPSLPPQPPPGLTSASPKHRLIRVAGKVASSEEREDPAEGPAPPTPPCPPIQSDISCRKVPILPPSTAADVSCTDELPWPPPVGQLDGEAGPSIMPGGPESSGDGRDSLRSSLAHGDTDAEPVGMAAEEPQGNRAGTDTADRAMGQQLWFHGDIGRVEAEQILQQHRTSSFLERRGVCAHACVVGPGRPRGARRKLSALRLGSGGRPLLPRTAPAGAGRRAALPAAPRAAALLLLCHVARPACASSPSERRRPLALLEARVAIRVCNSVPLAAESRGACHTARSASPGGRRAPRAQP
uniref:SH2 domain-containing adapter protein D-like isoform X8 n=1 Tax=Petromyzon marinus TaxID=7757 RepID=A0AAJ7T2F5_PETMA|nr:SH2 domain-containing adapter protein D-like isoform X8 [Petromyzon marinus]